MVAREPGEIEKNLVTSRYISQLKWDKEEGTIMKGAGSGIKGYREQEVQNPPPPPPKKKKMQ